ncbi:MAG TPA: AMP-binding protein [Sphingobacteriaceae bacterium]
MNAFDYLFSESLELDKNFVLGAGQEVSFRQLYHDSLAIAAFLKARAGEHRNILLIGHNSGFFIKAYLGIIRSGNICIPVNPAIEPSNLKHILEETGCQYVFSGKLPGPVSSSLRDQQQVEAIFLEDDLQTICRTPVSAGPDPAFDGDRTAEIIFTSGSTGWPKGVMISHKNICANTTSIISYLGLTDSDIMAVVLPFYYCYGLSLLHTHLKAGGSLVLHENFMLLGAFIQDLKRYRCTGFAGVPSHFQILLRKSGTFLRSDLPDLRYVTQAGGKLHDVFIEEFLAAFPHIDFYVMYGQTEATARLGCLPPDLIRSKLGSIGKGIPGVLLQVVDDQLRPVLPGRTGEVIARGDNIMKGYYKDPESTAKVLRDGWLFTGDLATLDEDGYIFLVGRKKEIIKVGGQRVSIKEIEEVILSVPEVVDCTVEGVYDDLLGESIKATVVLGGTQDGMDMKDKILQVCSSRLSLFKIPRIIQFENSLKTNGAGKKVKVVI